MTDEELFRQCLQVMEGNSTPLMKPLVIELVKVRIGRSTLKQRQYSKKPETHTLSPADMRVLQNNPWESE